MAVGRGREEEEEEEEKEEDLGDSRDSSWLDSPEAGEASSGCEAGMQIQLIQTIRFYLRSRISRQKQEIFRCITFCFKIHFE